ncbi:MAG: hypothetical protein QOG15_597, partial [Solirubrobacteraceae bacterium]|nr:hypothetical protein [Solirubrobacteraceae bacterium]
MTSVGTGARSGASFALSGGDRDRLRKRLERAVRR